MASIRKYPLKLVQVQTVKVEPDAIILPGVYNRWDEPVLYILGNHKPLNTKLKIKMFGTGVKFAYDANTMTFLGNYHDDKDCRHFFKVVEP